MDNTPVKTEVIVTQPLNTLPTMTKESFEEDCGYQLTDEEFKKIITYGNVTKTINDNNIDIKLRITDEISPFDNFVDCIIDKCQGVHDVFVTDFAVNNVNILEAYDGEMSAHDCAMFLMDFTQFNNVHHISITFPPDTIQNILY